MALSLGFEQIVGVGNNKQAARLLPIRMVAHLLLSARATANSNNYNNNSKTTTLALALVLSYLTYASCPRGFLSNRRKPSCRRRRRFATLLCSG